MCFSGSTIVWEEILWYQTSIEHNQVHFSEVELSLACYCADSKVDVFVVDLVGELPLLYAISEIAFVGGSLLEGN